MHEDVAHARAKIKALNTGLPFAPISLVRLDDLEIVKVNTDDLIGHVVYIKKEDSSKVLGKITSVKEQNLNLDLSKVDDWIDTNVFVTVLDKQGNEHSGFLLVN